MRYDINDIMSPNLSNNIPPSPLQITPNRAMGVDGVKVDAQSVLSSLRLRQGKGGHDLVLAYHKALQRSVLANFGGGHIQNSSITNRDHQDSSATSATTAIAATNNSKNHNSNLSTTAITNINHIKATTASAVTDMIEEFPIIHCMAHSQATLLSILALYPDVVEPSQYSPPDQHTSDQYTDDKNTGDKRNFSDSDINSDSDTDTDRDGHCDNDGGNVGDDTINDITPFHPLAHQRNIPIVRGSDDFWPTDAASHGPHLYANAINALFISQVGVTHQWTPSNTFKYLLFFHLLLFAF